MGGTMQKSFMKQMMDLLLKFVGYNILARNLFQIMKRKGCLAKDNPGIYSKRKTGDKEIINSVIVLLLNINDTILWFSN